MNITPFEAGKLAKHVYFKAVTLYIIQVLKNGKVACRYQSFNRTKDGSSEFILHYAEFEPSELEPYEPKYNNI